MNTQIKRGDIKMTEEEKIKEDILERAIALGKLSEAEYTRIKELGVSPFIKCECESGAGLFATKQL